MASLQFIFQAGVTGDQLVSFLDICAKVIGGLTALIGTGAVMARILPITRPIYLLFKDTLYRIDSDNYWQSGKDEIVKYRGGRIYGVLWRFLRPAFFCLGCLLSKSPFETARRRLERRILARDEDDEPVASITGEGCRQTAKFQNISDLLKLDEPITHYFRALQKHGKMDSGAPIESLTRIEVEAGFVAPMFLLSGLLPKLEEDWRIVGEQFDGWQDIAKKHFPHLQDIVSLQSFLLDCWLLWGPSISLPKLEANEALNAEKLCDCWSNGSYITAQYGYGDENNSICLIMDKSKAAEAIKGWVNRAGIAGGKYTAAQYPFALPASLDNGRVWCVAERFKRENGKIKHLNDSSPSFGTAIVSAGHPGWDRSFSLKGDVHAKTPDERRYYSAYLWGLFLTLEDKTIGREGPPNDKKGILLFRPETSVERTGAAEVNAMGRWRNLLTFFEHGNIADRDSYRLLEDHLAVKTARSLWRLAEKYKDHIPSPLYVYGGALDDLNCQICQAVENKDQQLWIKIDAEIEKLEATAAIDIGIDEALCIRRRIVMPSDPRHPNFRADLNGENHREPDRAGEIEDSKWRTWKEHARNELEQVSGCQLFGVVEEYYRWLESKAA
jgi:hypothetical protein